MCSVIGFPLGQGATAVKAYEAQYVTVTQDAQEVDMVVNVGWLKTGKIREVYEDIKVFFA